MEEYQAAILLIANAFTQTSITGDCIGFYKVQTNNDCYGIAQEAGVALDDFYSWNPAAKSDCSGLQSGEFVCIGVSGYATTISSGTPVPVTPTPTQVSLVSPFDCVTSLTVL